MIFARAKRIILNKTCTLRLAPPANRTAQLTVKFVIDYPAYQAVHNNGKRKCAVAVRSS